jgi:hypothetical protein
MTDTIDTEDVNRDDADEMIRGLEELIEFFNDNPHAATLFGETNMYAFSYTEDEWKELNKVMGSFTKNSTSYDLEAIRKFGNITLKHCISHERVCEKKVTGSHTVVRRQLPEGIEYEDVVVTEDIVEWVCPPEWR